MIHSNSSLGDNQKCYCLKYFLKSKTAQVLCLRDIRDHFIKNCRSLTSCTQCGRKYNLLDITKQVLANSGDTQVKHSVNSNNTINIIHTIQGGDSN